MDYRAMVNPTYITAKTSLFLLAGAGNEDAKGMIEALGTQDDLSRNMSKDNGGKPSIPEAELKAILTGNAAAIEARYEALSRYLHKGGYTNLFDIACGYTPRSIYCAKSDIDYVGVDVPVVAERGCHECGFPVRSGKPVARAGADLLRGIDSVSVGG